MRIAAICFACAIFACAAADEPATDAPRPPRVFELTFQRAAAPEKAAPLDFWYAMRIDCSTDPVRLQVSMRPEHGELTIVETQASPGVADDSPGAHCNKEKVAGKMVTYKAEPGYSGSDSVVIEGVYPGGSVHRHTYLIDVSDDPRVVRMAPQRPKLQPSASAPRGVAAPKTWGGPYEFDCDAPEGASAHWSGPLPAGRAVVTGTAKLLVTRKHETYVPTFALELYDSNPDISVSLAFVAYSRKPGNVDAMISLVEKQSSPPRRIALASLPATDKIPFTLRFEAGVLEVSVGSASRRVNIDFVVPTRISLSCSTGEVQFENVTIAD